MSELSGDQQLPCSDNNSVGPREPVPILFVIDRFETPNAGTERQLFRIVEGLDRERFSPHLLVLRDSEWLRGGDFPCTYSVLGRNKLLNPGTWLRLFLIARRLRKKKVGLAHVFFNDASILCPPVFHLVGIKTLISRRDMGYWYTKSYLLALRATARFVGGVIANSEAVAEKTASAEGISRDRIHVIYNGVVSEEAVEPSPERTHDLGELKSTENIIVGLVANLRPIKRIEDAIKAVALVQTEHVKVHLAVIGGGNTESLVDMARHLKIHDRVHFLGPRGDVETCLQYLDVGLLCSESEGFSNSIVEYMNSGLPVISTDAGGNPEAVAQGETGLLYEVGDTEALANAIRYLATAPDERHRMGDNARRVARARFGVRAMIRAHEDLYLEYLECSLDRNLDSA